MDPKAVLPSEISVVFLEGHTKPPQQGKSSSVAKEANIKNPNNQKNLFTFTLELLQTRRSKSKIRAITMITAEDFLDIFVDYKPRQNS